MKCQHGGCQTDAEFRVFGYDFFSWGMETSKWERYACRFHLHVTVEPTDEWPYISVERFFSEPEQVADGAPDDGVR